ncbi:alpha/beta-hydrolase [Dendrothele bispora CBS 962.96]|uniref:Alpha/beta-hydrolase n=1 Tax=Dendrothele bispora (strain CBS 962.96) TaxID=1314807 RepID=A0A4S8MWV9_DENBC|nr:alpha/beta-hydrolase [Dendrothele bispora CBS 962.96]
MSGADLPTIFDPSTCVRKGLCPVTDIRHQKGALESHSLYFEQHGTGPEKIILIMGLNSSSFGWSRQVLHFGRSPKHTILVFDNRGVGNSGVPRGPYSTSGMAEDVIVLLDYVGWKEPHSIHVVGLSLGGMISQELATRIPERIASLLLGVTTPGGYPWTNFPPWIGLKNLAKATFTKDIDQKIPLIHAMIYPTPWLDSKAEDDPQGRTNREIETETHRHRMLLTRPQTLLGALSQMCAGLSHHVTPARLKAISRSIPKVLIVTGDEDHLVDPKNSFYLKEQMKEAEFVQWKQTGHALHFQWPKRFNELVEKVVEEGRQRVKSEQSGSGVAGFSSGVDRATA